ncbi:MAG: membrane protein insertase YidC [Steroidobacteraceae bacterium]
MKNLPKNLRTFLWVALGMILFVNYQTWVSDYAPRDAAAAAAQAQAAEADKVNNPLTATVPQATGGAAPTPAAPAATGDVPVVSVPGATTATPVAAAAPTGRAVVTVHTDVLDVDVNLQGGELSRADLLLYPVKKGFPEPVRLMRQQGPGNQFLLQTGLAGAGSNAVLDEYPTHLTAYHSDYTGFRLEDGIDELRVPLKWTSPAGVEVVKTLVFRRGSYRVDVIYEVQNHSTAPWSAAPYAQLLHDMPIAKRSYFDVDSYSFTGPAYYDGTKYKKLKITNKEDAAFNSEVKDGWIASLQHHFVAAIIPTREQTHRFNLRVRDTEYLVTDLGPTMTLQPGEGATVEQTLFVGPKLQRQLEAIHPELGRAADFGVLTFLSRPLFWLLDKAHKVFGNWGLAIISITFLLKLLFYPLAETSGRSMAKMKLIAPRMKALQETYKDDRQKLGAATMELYKKEKVNPAAGCLPQLVQLPVFLAFYWVLLESVEMRQAPFFWWIQDLSSRDPLFILPLIMAGAMFLQFRLQPTPADPVQAKVFMILPIVMSVTFAFFPAGLVLYWVTNTLLTIAQQWNINRRIEAGTAARD